jgi:hypothetical protein
MSLQFDARVPLVFGETALAGPDDALLMEAGAPGAEAATAIFCVEQRHAQGCVCCGARTASGRALGALLQDRARGRVAFFKRVVAVTISDAARKDIEEALSLDPVARACFRQEGFLF